MMRPAGKEMEMKRSLRVLAATAGLMVYGLPVSGEEMGTSMHDEPMLSKVMIDRVERRYAEPDALTYWEGQAWLGGDINKLWLKSQGDVVKGDTTEANLEAYYSRAVAPYWDLQVGARHDYAFQGEPSRNWAGIGFKGLAPYKFDIDTTLYAGEKGRAALRTKVEYDMLLTQRLILMPELEMNIYSKNDVDRGIGSGLSNLDLGLRLRYEIRREFAPYVGVNWNGKYGDTASLARDAGLPVRDTQWLAGVRMWW